jgi:hypothetical protein
MKNLHNWLYVAAPFAFVVLVMALITTSTVISSQKSNSATVINSDLGSSNKFAVLAALGIHNVGVTTLVGNVGTYPATEKLGFNNTPSRVTLLRGDSHFGDQIAMQTMRDVNILSEVLNAESPVTIIPSKLDGRLTPGTYSSDDGAFILEGIITLDAENDPNAVFVFKTLTDLTFQESAKVILLNGAQACNVFWLVGGNTTLGEHSNIVGSVIAFLNADLKEGASINGNLIARKGRVLLNSNTITHTECQNL